MSTPILTAGSALAQMATARHAGEAASSAHVPNCSGCTGRGRQASEKETCRELREVNIAAGVPGCRVMAWAMVEMRKTGSVDVVEGS
jgi:hypothetical protein